MWAGVEFGLSLPYKILKAISFGHLDCDLICLIDGNLMDIG